MGNKKAFFAVSTTTLTAVATIVACGSDKAKPDAPVQHDAPIDTKAIDAPPDGPSFDFSCSSNQAPTTGSATITINGTVTEVSGSITSPSPAMSAGATVDACTGNCAGSNRLDRQTSGSNGAFTTAALATGGAPLDGYLHASKTGDRDTYLFPAEPLTADLPIAPVIQFTSNFSFLIQQSSKGLMTIIVTDCSTRPISDSTNVQLSIKQGGNAVQGATIIDVGSMGGSAAAAAAGTFIVLNVPPGTTSVGATYGGHTFLAHDVVVAADSVTETQIRPGY